MKTKQELVFEWLIAGELDYADLSCKYVKYLKSKINADNELIIDLTTTATMYRDEKTNLGSKKDLEIKYAKAVIKTGIYRDTIFEEELKRDLESL